MHLRQASAVEAVSTSYCENWKVVTGGESVIAKITNCLNFFYYSTVQELGVERVATAECGGRAAESLALHE
ncbi:hypothetical protein H6G97_29080 [Nostoc flagelliforme FACHB-838]|uniref:Uncharacterized protein n=1 Tax=Nostoc flagelliforme FACHB-838 TaxID=2692904 RepID=A0ABR8DWY9_9NOSO|nr:hypothetical protein [Nostoc flagelliforme]MBD2533396.1 hypothetical protein [Nostoc flagelliforme FACHB-838]